MLEMQSLPREFLVKLAKSYDLSSEQEEAFVTRFEGNKTEREVAEALCISPSALTSRMSGVYIKFSISGKGPGKLRHLHDFLLNEYQKSNPSTVLSEKVDGVDDLVREVRDRCCDKILTTYNHIQLYTLKQIDLNSLFVPVFVQQEPNSVRESRQKLPPEPALEIVERHPYLMILGKPGAGKSTLATYLATNYSEKGSEQKFVPVLLRIRDIDSSTSFQLSNELGTAFGTAADVTQRIIESGKVFLILDGLDEVSSQIRRKICQEVSNFTRLPHPNRVIITCRTDVKDYQLPSVFERIEIADFDSKQQNQFIEKWYAIKDKNPESWLAIRLQKHPECTSWALIDQIQQNERLQELAKTPILLSLICLVYFSKGQLPEKRSDLYQRGLEILLEDWDGDRGIENRVESTVYKSLNSDKKINILAELARHTFDQTEESITFEQATAINIVSRDQNCSPRESLEILEGIAADHGLVFRSARRKWEFSHLTFQEYFVAQWFVQSPNNDWENLAKNVCNSRWREVFLLIAEMANPVDELLTLMKHHIDELLIKDSELQELLQWVNEKAQLVKLYKPAAIRAFYLSFSLPLDLSFQNRSWYPFDVAYSLAKSEDTYEYFSQDLCGLYGVFQYQDKQVLKGDLSLTLNIIHHHTSEIRNSYRLSRLIDFEISRKLLHLVESLKDRASGLSKDFTDLNEWWKINGATWTNELRIIMLEHCNIGHDRQFPDTQKEKLQQYYDANKLLVDCLNTANVTDNVRQEIEDTLLLPIDEIKKRKSNLTAQGE